MYNSCTVSGCATGTPVLSFTGVNPNGCSSACALCTSDCAATCTGGSCSDCKSGSCYGNTNCNSAVCATGDNLCACPGLQITGTCKDGGGNDIPQDILLCEKWMDDSTSPPSVLCYRCSKATGIIVPDGNISFYAPSSNSWTCTGTTSGHDYHYEAQANVVTNLGSCPGSNPGCGGCSTSVTCSGACVQACVGFGKPCNQLATWNTSGSPPDCVISIP